MAEDPSDDPTTDTIPDKEPLPRRKEDPEVYEDEFDEEDVYEDEEITEEAEYEEGGYEDFEEEEFVDESEEPAAENDDDDFKAPFAPRPASLDLEELLDAPTLPAVRDHRRLRQATAAIVQDGMSLEDAAQEFGVEPDDLHVWHRTYVGFVNKQGVDQTREEGAQRTEKVEIDSRTVVKFNQNWEEMIRIAERERPQVSETRKKLMKFPLTSWMFRGDTVDKVAVTGALAVMVFSFLAVKLAADHRGKNDPDGKDQPPPTREEVIKAEGKNTIQEAAEALVKFAGVKTWKERLPYIRDSAELLPAIEKHYESNEDFLLGKILVTSPGEVIKRPHEKFVFFSAAYKKDTELIPIAFMIEVVEEPDSKPKYLVDWKVMVNYEPIPWDEFSEARLKNPTPFRVRVLKGDYFNHPFMDEKEFYSFKLFFLGRTDFVYGFAPRKSEVGRDVSNLLEKEYEKKRSMILELRYPDDAKFDDVLEIESLVAETWLGS